MLLTRWNVRRSILMVLLAAMVLATATTPAMAKSSGRMRKYTAKYHIIYTDLPREKVLEAKSRVNAMAEQYYKRTKGFAGKIKKRLPFYLYSRYEDYIASLNGRMIGSVGVYTGKELRATADTSKFSEESIWHTVQHEGFHQFVHMVISNGKNNIPIWLNEGLAEYFGEAIWTGDSLVTGVISPTKRWKKGKYLYTRPGRMARVQERIKKKEFKTFAHMLCLSHQQWNDERDVVNYDQVWAMTQFFAHAENGKYKKRFGKYIDDMAKGRPSLPWFRKRMKVNVDSLQDEFNKWWLSQKGSPTQDLYDEITVETLTCYLARAYHGKKRFKTAEEFFDAAEKGELKLNPRKSKALWLPPSLLKRALADVKTHKDWKWELKSKGRPQLVMTRPDGTVFTARFIPKGSKPPKIIVKTKAGAKKKESGK